MAEKFTKDYARRYLITYVVFKIRNTLNPGIIDAPEQTRKMTFDEMCMESKDLVQQLVDEYEKLKK